MDDDFFGMTLYIIGVLAVFTVIALLALSAQTEVKIEPVDDDCYFIKYNGNAGLYCKDK